MDKEVVEFKGQVMDSDSLEYLPKFSLFMDELLVQIKGFRKTKFRESRSIASTGSSHLNQELLVRIR